MTRLDQIRGCLIGGAVGDALGADIEFLQLDDIRNDYGPHGVTDYTNERAEFTDDTQMTLFTAEGLLDSLATGDDELGCLHRAYLRWYVTQNGTPKIDLPRPYTGLVTLRGMHRQKAPGITCLGALKAATKLRALADNDSKGCGGIMRAAPVGLFAPQIGDDSAVFEMATKSAALTHGHPSGHFPAGCLAVMIAALLRGGGPVGAVTCAATQLRMRKDSRETLQAIEGAVKLAALGRPTSPEQLETLGSGWTGEEALAISIACLLSANGFADGVRMAVNHSGDSDSTGAITGNLLGAMFGVYSIPEPWRKRLDQRDVVDSVALRLDNATGLSNAEVQSGRDHPLRHAAADTSQAE